MEIVALQIVSKNGKVTVQVKPSEGETTDEAYEKATSWVEEKASAYPESDDSVKAREAIREELKKEYQEKLDKLFSNGESKPTQEENKEQPNNTGQRSSVTSAPLKEVPFEEAHQKPSTDPILTPPPTMPAITTVPSPKIYKG